MTAKAKPKGVAGSTGRSVKFCAAPGAPFNSDEADAVIGPALVQLAEDLKVGDVRALNKMQVFTAVRDDPKHVLRPYVYTCDEKDAARKHYIEQAGILLRSIRITTVDVGEIHAQSLFVPSSEVMQHHHGGGYTRRPSRVLRSDALKYDEQYMSVLGGAIRRFFSAFEWVERWTSEREPPADVRRLITDVRSAIDSYKAEIKEAAE